MSASVDHASQVLWKSILDGTIDWESIIDPKGKILYTSPNTQDFTGYSPEEVVADNKVLLNCIDKDQREELRQFFWRRIKNTKEILRIEFKISSSNGVERWLASKSHPLYTESGVLVGFRFSSRDITNIKKSQLYLEKLNVQQNVLVLVTQVAASNEPFEGRIQAILKIIGEYTGVSRVYIFEDTNTGNKTSNTFEWCNEGVSSQKNNLQNFDYSLIPSWDEILTAKGTIMVPDINTLPEDIYQILSKQGIKAILILPLHFNSKRVGFIGFDECTKNRVWCNEEISLLQTVANTITNSFYRRKYEKALEELSNQLQQLLDHRTFELQKSESYYRAIIEMQPDLFCRWLPDTTLTFVNDAYCKFFNCSESKLLGKKWINFHKEYLHSRINKNIKTVIETRKPKIYERKVRNAKNEIRWFQWIDIPIINPEGVITEMQSGGRDITDKIQSENQLRKAKEKAEELDRIKSEFLNLISHELRTPLNGILGFSEMISSTSSVDKILTFNNYIRQSGTKLFRMIEDILTLTNLHGGKTHLKEEEFKLLPVMQKLFNAFEMESVQLKRDIQLEMSILFNPELSIVADKEKLIFIITRLLDNAFAFCEKGKITFGAEFKGLSTHFFVKDTGVGIAEENRETIFLAFKKINNRNRNFHDGLGNSLYIVKELLGIMEGTIWFESEVNKGCAFYFNLPFKKISN